MTYKAENTTPNDRRQNTTNYDHPQETNLLNIHRAMEYNALGQPVLRTTLGGAETSQRDAFGRLRMATPYTLFDTFHRYQDNGKVTTYTAGGGTTTHNANASVINCSVGTASGDAVYRETSRVFAYQPGKSLQVLITFVMAPGKTNLRQRIGYFDVNNGIYLQQNGTQLSIVKRSSSSGTLVETVVNQADWNVDPLNGSGSSTRVLDITKAQIFWTDIEWLGVGCVRCGFVIDGRFIQVHQFNHSNIVDLTYMGTACLPLRLEVENTGPTASASTYKQICATVISEGGYELRGRPRSVGHTIAAPYTMSSPATVYPLISLRLKADRPGAIVIPRNFSFSVQAAANFRWVLINGATTSGGTWIDAGSGDSSVEYNLTATSLSGGNTLEMGYVMASNQSSISPSLENYPFFIQLERNTFTGTMYEFVLAAVTDGNNQKVHASVNWEEIT